MFDRPSFAKKNACLNACGSLRSGAAPTPINSKMNHVANQLNFKLLSVQKFKDFLKKVFK